MSKSVEQYEVELKLRTYKDIIKNNPMAKSIDVPLNLEQLTILIDVLAERRGNI